MNNNTNNDRSNVQEEQSQPEARTAERETRDLEKTSPQDGLGLAPSPCSHYIRWEQKVNEKIRQLNNEIAALEYLKTALPKNEKPVFYYYMNGGI